MRMMMIMSMSVVDSKLEVKLLCLSSLFLFIPFVLYHDLGDKLEEMNGQG